MNFHDLSHGQQVAELARHARGAMGLLSEEIAAAIIGIEVSTLATWRSHGKGPEYVKLGKSVFYTINDTSKWISAEMAAQIAARKRVDVALQDS